MKVSKKSRNAHIAWMLDKYSASVRDIKAQIVSICKRAAEKMVEIEERCTSSDCTPEEWVKLVPSLNRVEERCKAEVEHLTDAQSLIGKLDAVRALLHA